ncbi:hypothetical protein N9A28_04445 [Sulfurimonas sp.]|nr:hypothetical protein [Sulfurimonas sp.]
MYKILIYDNNKKDVDYFCELLNNIHIDFEIDKLSHYDDFMEIYPHHLYDIVFIDFSDKNGKKILSHFQKNNPKQKVALLSDSFECVENMENCEMCKDTPYK